MNEEQFRGRKVLRHEASSDMDEAVLRERRAIKRMANPFDLQKAMDNGGKCLAGDRPARVVCTDIRGEDERPDSAPLLVVIDNGSWDATARYDRNGLSVHGPKYRLRNLPEEQEVEVALYMDKYGRKICACDGEPVNPLVGWELYGPPVKVKFTKG